MTWRRNPPAVGVTDMGDPALDAGVQLGEVDFARKIGREPRPASPLFSYRL